MQLNYSNYYVHAQQHDHPMGASLLINGNDGLEMINKPSTIANNQSEENARKYSNNSFQLSLPIGADIAWLAITVPMVCRCHDQPTYVLSGNAFLLSSDMNYSVRCQLCSQWNLNAGFETFILQGKPGRDDQCRSRNSGFQFRSSYIDKIHVRCQDV